MKNQFNALVFGAAIIGAAMILAYGVIHRNQTNGTLTVKGLGKKDFTSDLIYWEGTFSAQSANLEEGYSQLSSDRDKVLNYLVGKGLNKDQLVFSAVSTSKDTRNLYADNGRYLGEEFIGYNLEQRVEITSNQVDEVEKISREITELLNMGVQFYSQSPRYYFTQIEDLKVEMVSQATENARIRAEKMAEKSGAKLGSLKSAQMGIFQITGLYSNEEYSWGGVYNTTSKDKTASITMSLVYEVE
jgi:hypothetical protein